MLRRPIGRRTFWCRHRTELRFECGYAHSFFRYRWPAFMPGLAVQRPLHEAPVALVGSTARFAELRMPAAHSPGRCSLHIPRHSTSCCVLPRDLIFLLYLRLSHDGHASMLA